MRSRTGVWCLGLAVILLIGVIALQVLGVQSARAGGNHSVSGRLSTLLPSALAFGGVRDEPIAATEEMKKAVGELLNFTDGVYRIYQLQGVRVSVYVAWWEAGRMAPRLVATHTPDVCWPDNGWVRDQTAEGGLSALSEELRASGFAEGEVRVFRMQNKPEYVVFWHKVGDQMLSYHTGYAPPWWSWLDEMWRGGLNLRKEQLFVRVSSDRPLESVWGRPELEPLRRALLELGLRAK
jgi:hypothetical protein